MSSTLQLRILLFAGVRDAAGCEFIDLEINAPASVAEVMERAAAQIPAAAGLIRVSRLAVDGQYVSEQHTIDHSSVELALIPPVSGG